MVSVPFAKMNGIGNSILVVDLRGTESTMTGDVARRLGTEPRLHFDQLMAITAPRTVETDAYVDIFNIDGSPAEACGNGTRCVAWVLARASGAAEITIETAGGFLPARRVAETIFSVDMGPPRLDWREIPLAEEADTADVALRTPPNAALTRCSAVSMGNPHAIFFVPDAAAIPIERLGPAIEHDPVFPERANVSFAEILSPGAVKLRVWERGAGATLACGSAACATLVAAVRAGLTGREVRIGLPGGDLHVVWREDGHVVMTGGVELEHEGTVSIGALEPAR